MVDSVAVFSLILLAVVFVILALFIWKLQLNVLTESQYLRNRNRKPMASLSKVTLPFKVEVVPAPVEKNSLSLKVTGSKDGCILYYCCVGISELKKVLQSERSISNEKSIVDVLNLISMWCSKMQKFTFTEDTTEVSLEQHYSKLPENVQKELLEVISDQSSVKTLVPFVAYSQLSDEEKMEAVSDNDVVALLTAFSCHGGKYETVAQYIETAGGKIFPIKELFQSGVSDYSSSASSSESNELCIICHHYPVTRVLLPCRHSCVCKICFKKLESCPVCRQFVQSYFIIKDESQIPMSEEEERDQLSNDISQMGIWNLIKSIWNAS
ncbi:cell growth regulator with RING finger domain protein 1-like [Hydractinia symbiolongicarpus]|uniref:cell growth regulator with RING finger domain protein 1-like n=1 Tax=Hydractinia symbiolongicarpus TaxID=13093 RepID=UPI00254C4BCB|nr:cell growth regulator with RING finger domain protein 1-like [Hydractinia symbiolongicarpus]